MELTALSMRVAGTGAVSPAGWGGECLVRAVEAAAPLPVETIHRAPGAVPQRVRRVPKPVLPPSQAREPRLRRTSPISAYLVAAAMEALGAERVDRMKERSLRVGIIVTLFNGCVNFSRRFYAEVLENPATASPLIFPETVFNAPASHLGAILGSTEINYTMVGDTAAFAAAFDVAALWLESGDLDGVLVAAAEEVDWLSAEASGLFHAAGVVAEGAGAVYLEPSESSGIGVQRPLPLRPHASRGAAARSVRETWGQALLKDEAVTLLCDGRVGARNADRIEEVAFGNWAGPRCSVGAVVGDGLGTRSAWQCVIAARAVAARRTPHALVSAIGTSQQALGVLISSTHPFCENQS